MKERASKESVTDSRHEAAPSAGVGRSEGFPRSSAAELRSKAAMT